MKDKELEDEIERLRKLKKPNKSDIEYFGKIKSELKGRKEARKETLEDEIKFLNGSGINFPIEGKTKDMEYRIRVRLRYLKQQLKSLEKK
jgi:septal ring factor EnvC (AmiA/AmiB activator)